MVYFRGDFRREMAAYAAAERPAGNCGHIQVPFERRAWLPGEGRRTAVTAAFRCVWYGMTLADQVLFTHFDAETNRRWQNASGGHPVPVIGAGMGCVRVARPNRLLTPAIDAQLWGDYVNAYLAEVGRSLEPATGVRPAELFSACFRDRDFNRPENWHESHLRIEVERLFGPLAV